MSLTTGQTLSFYQILAPLGAGGMGEVYRARDTRLEREVAIKVLPEHFADDEERLRRFEREAKTLASLNHPNVAQVFGIDQVGSTCFMAMELVEGEDLAKRLERRPLAVDEAIEVCRQIAEGLEAAHDNGIIHRDLKPANVIVTSGVRAKVLDFGLAKPLPAAGPEGKDGRREGSTTAEHDSFFVTEEGLVLGTPTYMSPEQARGRQVDRRTDIWAFGCVLFECLSGKRAFGGENFSDVVVSILERGPDFDALPAGTPTRVVELIRRCLVKDPRERLRDIGEARIALARAFDATGNGAEEGTTGRRVSWVLPAAVVFAGLLVAVAAWLRPGTRTGPPEAKLSVTLPMDAVLDEGGITNVAISRDGRKLAWVGGPRRSLHWRSLDSFEVFRLAETENASSPVFSPDGEWLAYFSRMRIQRVRLDGGEPTTICDWNVLADQLRGFGSPSRGLSWGGDDTLIAVPSTSDGLFRVSAAGGEVEHLTLTSVGPDERTHRWPESIEGGRAVLFTVDSYASTEFYDDAAIEVLDLTTRERHVLLTGASMARYAAGSLVYARDGALYRQGLDTLNWTLSGEPEELVRGVRTAVSSGAVQFDLTEAGQLVYAPGEEYSRAIQFEWRDPDADPVPIGVEPGVLSQPALSPDGESLAFARASVDSSDIFLFEFGRGAVTRLTNHANASRPIWSPDGKDVVYARPSGLYRKTVASSEDPELLLKSSPTIGGPFAACFLDAGTALLVEVQQAGTGRDVVRLDLATGSLTPILESRASEYSPVLSADGQWLAYTSTERGRAEVFLARLEAPEVRWQASSEGGRTPEWSNDGKSLYFLVEGEDHRANLWAVDVELAEEPRLEVPRQVLADFGSWDAFQPPYDLDADGRILATRLLGGVETPGNELRLLDLEASGRE